MMFKEFGDSANPAIVLLHGEGLSWWSFKDTIYLLEAEYNVITPVIDGHGEDGATDFISIEDSAQKLIHYIDKTHNGSVLALCGLSLGAQIAVDVLSKRTDIAKYAVIESAMVVPSDRENPCFSKSSRLFYALMSHKWFAKLQARALYINDHLFDRFYRDSQNISEESRVNITLSKNGYTAPDTLKNTKAKVLIIIGGKEFKMMDKSLHKLMSMLPQAQVCIVPEMKHGDVRLARCKEYLTLVRHLWYKGETLH